MTTYSEFSQLPVSEKVTIVTAEAVEQVKLFDLFAPGIYVRNVNHFVVGVKVFGLSLQPAASTSLLENQFFFDPKAKKLYVRLLSDINPKITNIGITFRFFFADAPCSLPYDFNSGEVVDFESRVQSIGSLGQQLDDQNTGIVLESSSSVSFENSDGYFDLIFDSLIWENQTIKFYSWSPLIAPGDAQKLFEGVIESKDFSPSKVTFKVKDFVFKLKNKLNMETFSEADGVFEPSMIGRPKRRIYGQVKQIKTQGIDKVLGGFSLTGTVSGVVDSKTLIGTGTQFLDQLSPGDEIIISLEREEFKVGIESIESDTSATLGKEIEADIVNRPVTVRPSIPYRKKNRSWHIAGHKLREPSAEITEIISSNRVRANSTLDFFAGDSVKINGEFVQVRRISGNVFILESALIPAPIVGDLIIKNPVSKVYFGSKELIIDRDFSISNGLNAKVEINDLAEFNITEQRSIGASFSFTNGSRQISTTANVDLRTIINPRDWIRKDLITEADWYEVLEVKEQSILLRTPFLGTTSLNSSALRKNVELIDDDSLITADCLGIEIDGKWIKTPGQAVRHLVLNDAGFSSVNEASFIKADASCGFIMSLPIPFNLGDQAPQIRDVITNVNESVFGSLYGNSSWDISYSILNSDKPEGLTSLKDDDIISFDVVSEQSIIDEIKVNYRRYTDIFTGEDGFETLSETSSFVNTFIGIKNSLEKTIYLFEEDKAKIIAQRILMFRSLSNSKVQVKAKLNLALKAVNDKMFIELDRLYLRYGGRDRRKIGIITGIKKNGTDVDVEFTDVGNIFNRIPSVAPNTTPVYLDATRDDVVQYGFILDNDTNTPNPESEIDLGNNLIG